METLSSDDLSVLTEDQLKKLFIAVRSTINKNKRIKKESKELEVYFCYIVREMEHRAGRHHGIRAIN